MRRGIWIPDDLWRAVQRLARKTAVLKKRNVSAAEIVRKAIEAYLRKHGEG